MDEKLRRCDDCSRTFKVNNYISLKLEDDGYEQKTVIYVAGERFHTCAYLLLVRPNELFQENIDSIDDAAEKCSGSNPPPKNTSIASLPVGTLYASLISSHFSEPS